MLSERQLEALLDVFRKRMQGVTVDYLSRMGEHLRDIGELTASDVNRIVELKRLNANMEQIKREIAKAARMSVDDIEKLFKAVAESDLRFANTVYASDHEPTVKANPAIERILKAQAKITKQELSNLSQTTLLSDGYREAIDVAVQTVQGGVTDYTAAIRRAMKSAASEGLRVRYPNSGLTRRLDSAVRMNVLDGVRAVNQDIMRQVGKEFKADGIELSAHNLCAEDHLPYQGTQMSIKEFERLQNRLDRPFGMWNCHHSWHYIILGISKPAYTPEELEEFKRNSREEITIDGVTKTRYEWTQEQRKIETAIRYQKDIAVAAKASGDMMTRRECQYNINKLWKRYDKVSEAAGLKEKPERTRVEGFSAVKAVDPLKKTQKSNIISQKAEKTPETGDGVRTICKLDRDIYSCITKDIATDEVVLINERILHIQDHHPNDFERYGRYIKEMIEHPDYIIEANREKDKSGLVLKEFADNGEQFRLVLRLATSTDKRGSKNSIITFQYVKKKEYTRLTKNKKVLYKRK